MDSATLFRCLVCGEALRQEEAQHRCVNRHSFGIAPKGYVNLLLHRKGGGGPGDNQVMLESWRAFLRKGYYQPYSYRVTYLVDYAGVSVLAMKALQEQQARIA